MVLTRRSRRGSAAAEATQTAETPSKRTSRRRSKTNTAEDELTTQQKTPAPSAPETTIKEVDETVSSDETKMDEAGVTSGAESDSSSEEEVDMDALVAGAMASITASVPALFATSTEKSAPTTKEATNISE